MSHTALIIGGSLGGLLAAAALSGSFDEVVLLERDELPERAEPRAGVPQGSHAHGLLAGGLAALDALLPGLLEDLAASGCPSGDNLTDAAWVFAGRRLAVGESGVRGMCVARPLLEQAVRARVRQLSNVRFRTHERVVGLLRESDRVAGVRVHAEGQRETEIAAELVIDASGRNSKLPQWLEALGVQPPAIDEVRLDTHYVSRVYPRRPSDLDGGIALIVVSEPGCPRGGIALAIDADHWLVSQYAMGGERPPRDAAGLRAFAARLPSPRLAQLLGDRAPLTGAATMRFPSSIRRRYESAPLPAGLLVCADALSSFNPTFGQGITVAAKQALVLRDLGNALHEPGCERAFFERAARIVDVAWNAAAGRSFLYPGVEGRPSPKMRLANAYLPRVVRAAHDDPLVATALLRAMHFLAPPESLFSPWLLWRVLRGAKASAQRRAQSWQDADDGLTPDPLRGYSAGQGRLSDAR